MRSLAVPGWGQWYNEKKLKAAVVFAAELGIRMIHLGLEDPPPVD